MTDFLTAMGAPAIRTVDGMRYTFAQPTMQQIALFVATQKRAKMDNARRLLDEMKADPQVRFQCLAAIDERYGAMGSIDSYALTPEGCIDIFQVAFGTQVPPTNGFTARFVTDVVQELIFGKGETADAVPKSAPGDAASATPVQGA